jgi:hypothetical protein
MRYARALTVGSLVCLAASPVSAATLVVAPNGADSGSCGAKAAPCRTITRAIANAGIDDTIVVAPGRYGDVNGDLSLTGPDEETPDVDGCDCVLEIGKRVKLVSRDGAAATVIDGGKAGFRDTVRLSADGALIGKKNKGFTITGAGTAAAGLNVVANGTTVAGHVFVDNPFAGVLVSGSRNLITASRSFPRNGGGFVLTGEDNTISESAASSTAGAAAIGFSINGNRNTVRGVLATGNAVGIGLLGTGHVVSGSVAVRNTITGVDVAGTGSSAVVTKTTIHSNGGTLTANCGLFVSAMNGSAVATGNFWGASTGPGPDPADEVCIAQNGTATTTPFATKEHKTPTKPLR